MFLSSDSELEELFLSVVDRRTPDVDFAPFDISET